MFLGKPGGGKSFGALKDIVDELVLGTRTVVTNLAVDVGALSAWIQKNYPHADFDPVKRFRLMTDAETRTFWFIRGPNKQVDGSTADKSVEGHYGVVPSDMFNVLYVIDECHLHFDARSWAKNGAQLTFYNSQHRKFNDEVIFVTQFLDLVDKRVKGFAQDYVYFVNNGLQRFMTHFRMPKYFTVKTYSRPQSDGGRKDQHQAAARYQLDPTLAACYDTSAGVGIPGRQQREISRMRGVPIYFIVVPVIALGYFLTKAPDLATQGVMNVLETGQPKPAAADLGTQNAALMAPSPNGRPSGEVATLPTVASGPLAGPPPPVYVHSVAVQGRKALVTLSDGQILSKGTGLLAITEDYVYTKDGSRYPRRYRRADPEPAKPAGV